MIPRSYICHANLQRLKSEREALKKIIVSLQQYHFPPCSPPPPFPPSPPKFPGYLASLSMNTYILDRIYGMLIGAIVSPPVQHFSYALSNISWANTCS